MKTKALFILSTVAMQVNYLRGMDREYCRVLPSSPQAIRKFLPPSPSLSPQPMSPISGSVSPLEQTKQVMLAYRRLLRSFNSVKKSALAEDEKVGPLQDLVNDIDRLRDQAHASAIKEQDEKLSQLRRQINQHLNGLFQTSPTIQRRKR